PGPLTKLPVIIASPCTQIAALAQEDALLPAMNNPVPVQTMPSPPLERTWQSETVRFRHSRATSPVPENVMPLRLISCVFRLSKAESPGGAIRTERPGTPSTVALDGSWSLATR